LDFILQNYPRLKTFSGQGMFSQYSSSIPSSSNGGLSAASPLLSQKLTGARKAQVTAFFSYCNTLFI